MCLASKPPERSDSDPHRARLSSSRWIRAGWGALGFFFVLLGAVGVVVPGLPTTPFLLVAAACFLRCSQRLYDWLTGHRTFGPLIRAFREGEGVSARVKTIAIGTMWVFVLFALGPGLPSGPLVPRAVVGGAAILGTIYLLRLPTRRPDP